MLDKIQKSVLDRKLMLFLIAFIFGSLAFLYSAERMDLF